MFMLVYIYSLYSLILINENTVFPSFGFVIWYQSKFPNSSRVLFSFFQCCIFSFLFLIFLRKFPLFLRNFLFLRIVLPTMASAATNGTIESENPSPSSPQDSPMDDPLFLHHAENPSLVLVT